MKAFLASLTANWKTNLVAVVAFIYAVPQVVQSIQAWSNGQPANWKQALVALLIAAGMAAAKDSTNHSTQGQINAATAKAETIHWNKSAIFIIAMCLVSMTAHAQTQTPVTPFQSTSISFGLSPVTLPGYGTTLAGAETDTLFHFTTNNVVGPTVLVSSSTFVGGRYNRIFPSVSTWLQNHTALTGNQYEVGFTLSGGVVESGKSQWGGRGGFFINYALNSTWAMGFEVQANYLPGIVGQGKWAPSIAVGPNFHF
jgi:hypothetical protein